MAEINDIIQKELESFGKKLVGDLQESLRKSVTFGGQDSRLSNKIKFFIYEYEDKVVFKLSMPSYAFIINKGRRPGPVSKEGQESVSDWIKRKGNIFPKFRMNNLQDRLRKQAEAKSKNHNRKQWKKLKPLSFKEGIKALTFLVSRKIKEKGFAGNNFYTDVIDELDLDSVKTDIQNKIKELVIFELTK